MAHVSAATAQAREVQKWAGSFRDQNTPTLLLDPSPMRGSLLVVTYGGRDHTGDKTPAGYELGAQVDGAGIFYRFATGDETSVTLSAGTTPAGTGRARMVAVEYASSIGWPFSPLDGAATGIESASPASAGTALPERSVRALVVAAWGSEDELNDRDYGDLVEVDYGHTAPAPPVVPEGVILGWPSTAGSIPGGYDRVTALDSRYLKGIPTSGTAPGSNGGAVSHSHTTPGHVHGLNHSHTTAANTGAGSGSVAMLGGSPTQISRTVTHTHTRPSVNSTSVNSQSSAPGAATEVNDPAHLAAVWIESEGISGVPSGAVAAFNGATPVGWSVHSDSSGRFLKGAAPAGNGGATSGGNRNHVHAVNAHTHAGTAHVHSSSTTGGGSAELNVNFAGSTGMASSAHTHAITVASGDTASLSSGSGGNSGTTEAPEPMFHALLMGQCDDPGGLPTGMIAAWRGSLASIPDEWALCDGSSSTPNLIGRYVKGAANVGGVGVTGGSSAGHTHTGGSHSHTTSGHVHGSTAGAASATVDRAPAGSPSVNASSTGHTHTLSNTDSATPTVVSVGVGTLASQTTEPLHQEVAFIQFQGEAGGDLEDEGYGATAAGMVDEPTSVNAQMSWTGGGTAVGVMAVFQLGMMRGVNMSTGTNDPRYLVGASR